MQVAFIGLGNVGGKLAGNLARSGHALVVHDLNEAVVAPLVAAGARWSDSPAQAAADAEVVITCLPSPAACAAVLEGAGGVLETLRPGTVWIEMSTTDAEEVGRLAAAVRERGGEAADCPVSGGCHRAATGNIAILAGCERTTFEKIMPVLEVLGRDILHTGALGTASQYKVLTNYLASAHLVALAEALTTVAALDLDLNAYEAIRVSSGNSFVHETESQVILNGSRNIGFTLGLVQKDVGLFQSLAERAGLDLELSPLLLRIFADAIERFGADEWSPNVIRRLEEQSGRSVLAPGFPPELEDHAPRVRGAEVILPKRG
ncbi:MAG: 3-hydroxyisobutyrate dehydrogenase [Gammaproteobacteria bacterium]|nr:3-hydroxyisobutyrate dehydrogenase [Gammaproteobacteria bacterium]